MLNGSGKYCQLFDFLLAVAGPITHHPPAQNMGRRKNLLVKICSKIMIFKTIFRTFSFQSRCAAHTDMKDKREEIQYKLFVSK